DGATGPMGPQGPQGPQGTQGPAGNDGATGPQGPQGPAGNDGATGPQGPQGPAGNDGATGPQGPQGPAGNDGATGPMGPQGPAGNDGATGPMGPQGPAGNDGATGPQGPQGPAGNDGATGPQGPQGPAGNDGATGPQGPAGNGFQNGTAVNQVMYWNGNTWTVLNPGTDGQVLAICGGQLMWKTISGVCGANVSALNCNSATVTGTAVAGTAVLGVTINVSYTGGNGLGYSDASFTSTGVTGLTATALAGTLANGNGTVSFVISGTPSAGGSASFLVTFGNQSCTLNLNVQGTLSNPTTGKVWMDRNLGASQVATSSSDASAYGDIYQWGRGKDGHENRYSGTTSTLSSSDQPGHGNYITASSGSYDWRSGQNSNLWQGVNGTNNPCPSGFRVPTSAEWQSEYGTWSSQNMSGGYNALKLSYAGSRLAMNGSLSGAGSSGLYWTSSTGFGGSTVYNISSSSITSVNSIRAAGASVRCIKD
ncbi:MAG: hypothetical protein ACK5G8_03045, partial [Flavobacteriales bacterium]